MNSVEVTHHELRVGVLSALGWKWVIMPAIGVSPAVVDVFNPNGRCVSTLWPLTDEDASSFWPESIPDPLNNPVWLEQILAEVKSGGYPMINSIGRNGWEMKCDSDLGEAVVTHDSFLTALCLLLYQKKNNVAPLLVP